MIFILVQCIITLIIIKLNDRPRGKVGKIDFEIFVRSSYGFSGECLVILFFFAYKEEKAFWSIVIYFIAKRNVRLGWYEAYKSAKRSLRASTRAHNTESMRKCIRTAGKLRRLRTTSVLNETDSLLSCLVELLLQFSHGLLL